MARNMVSNEIPSTAGRWPSNPRPILVRRSGIVNLTNGAYDAINGAEATGTSEHAVRLLPPTLVQDSAAAGLLVRYGRFNGIPRALSGSRYTRLVM